MEKIGDIIPEEYKRGRPRYTIIHHKVREMFGLTLAHYAVIDSIDQLSHRPDYPWCKEKKEKLGSFVSATRQTVHNAIKRGLEEELIEKNDKGELRSTYKWINAVRLYSGKN